MLVVASGGRYLQLLAVGVLALSIASRTSSGETYWLRAPAGLNLHVLRAGAAADVNIADAVHLRDGLRRMGRGEIIQFAL